MNALARHPDLVRTSVYQQLRSEVLSCVLRPGQQLQEKDIAARFGVSRSPIRDALLKLEEQGLVEVLPRKGYRVRRIDMRDVRDMYAVRVMLERECIAMLIEGGSDEVLQGLEAFRRGPEGSDLGTWIAYNRALHGYFHAHCGNARLARVSSNMIDEFDRLTWLGLSAASDRLALDEISREHVDLIDAIQARNRRLAAVISRRHIEGSRRRVLASLESVSIIDSNPGSR